MTATPKSSEPPPAPEPPDLSGRPGGPDGPRRNLEWTLRAVACSIRDDHQPGAILDLAVAPAPAADQVGDDEHLTCLITLNGGEDEYGWQIQLPLPGVGDRSPTVLAGFVEEVVTPWLIRHGLGDDLEIQRAQAAWTPADHFAVEVDRTCWRSLPEDR